MRALLVGCGKMGRALLQGLINAPDSAQVVVVDPAAAVAHAHAMEEGATQPSSVTLCASFEEIPAGFSPDIAVLAVKPQTMALAVPAYGVYARSAVFLSIAAGMTLARLEAMLGGPSCAVVRAMPNLPASVGQGMTVAVSNVRATQAQRDMCSRVLRGAGMVEWVADEGVIDAVTALSGSGPAYVFALAEAMAQAGAALGLPQAMAEKLARQTIIGSGALLAQLPDSAEALRRAVTSKGGTTEAALTRLLATDQGLPDLLRHAMQAAAARAKELAQA